MNGIRICMISGNNLTGVLRGWPMSLSRNEQIRCQKIRTMLGAKIKPISYDGQYRSKYLLRIGVTRTLRRYLTYSMMKLSYMRIMTAESVGLVVAHSFAPV